MGLKVNKTKFAEIRGCSQREITRLIDLGLPASGSGIQGEKMIIDTQSAIDWIIEHEISKRVSVADPGTGVVDIRAARLIKTIEEHRKLKLGNDEEDGHLLPSDDVRQAFSAALVEVAALLDGAAGKMAGGDAVLRQRLLDEHRRIRAAFADRLARFGVDPGDKPPRKAAAKTGRVAVG